MTRRYPYYEPTEAQKFERDHRNMTRMVWIGIVLFFAGLLLIAMTPAHARSAFRGEPLPYSCDTVRIAVKSFSQKKLMALAKEFGVKVTPSQRREAQKCLAQ